MRRRRNNDSKYIYITKKKKRRRKKLKFKKRFYVIISLLLLLIVFCWNKDELAVNLYILNCDEKEITIAEEKVKLWDKTLKKINENSNEIYINKNDKAVLKLNIEKIKKNTSYDFSFKDELIKCNYDNLKNVEGEKIKFNNKECIESIENIKLNKNEKWKDLDKIGIFSEIDSKNVNCINSIDLKSNENQITINKELLNPTMILAYVSIESINVNENVEINKDNTYELNIEFKPDNATDKTIKFEYDNEMIELTNDRFIKGLKEGETKIVLKFEKEKLEKTINVKINSVAEEIKTNESKYTLYEGDSVNLNAKVVPENAVNTELKYSSSDETIAKVDETGKITAQSKGKATITVSTVKEPVITKEININVKNKDEETVSASASTVGITYIKNILLVNKKYELPSSYAPNVNSTALEKFNQMKAAASKEGISLYIVSGYRSYETQKSLYNSNVSKYGEEKANTFSAKPGQSEHQTGLAFDVNSTLYAFANTKEGKWLAENCYDYGFIVRFLKGKEAITGYTYEPWHIRYVGEEHSLKMKETGECLEEYLGVQ